MLAIYLVLGLLWAVPAASQDSAMGVDADTLEWRQNDKTYVASGNASVTREGTTISADRLIAHYVEIADGKTDIVKVEAEGNVHIKGTAQDVYGDKGVYEVARQVAVLTGSNLRLVTGADTVTARDALEYWQAKELAVARGAAMARRGDDQINADTLVALLAKDGTGKTSIKRMSAEGNVLLTTPTEIVQGNSGVYDPLRQVATLEGNVRITRGQSQLNGARAVVDMKNGVSKLLADKGGRVKGLLAPNDAPKVAP